MKEITIIYPDDCDLDTAFLHLKGCFNESQLDYRRIKEGKRNGVPILFCNDREGYFYRTKRGYILQLQEMREKQ